MASGHVGYRAAAPFSANRVFFRCPGAHVAASMGGLAIACIAGWPAIGPTGWPGWPIAAVDRIAAPQRAPARGGHPRFAETQ